MQKVTSYNAIQIYAAQSHQYCAGIRPGDISGSGTFIAGLSSIRSEKNMRPIPSNDTDQS